MQQACHEIFGLVVPKISYKMIQLGQIYRTLIVPGIFYSAGPNVRQISSFRTYFNWSKYTYMYIF